MPKTKRKTKDNLVIGMVIGLIAVVGFAVFASATDLFRVEGGLDSPTINVVNRLLDLAEGEQALGGDLAFGGTTSADWNVGGDLTVDTNILKVDVTNDRVGIATTTPFVTFSVNGEAYFNSTTTIDIIQLEAQTATTTCGASVAGNIMFSADSEFYGCDGTNWIRLNN